MGDRVDHLFQGLMGTGIRSRVLLVVAALCVIAAAPPGSRAARDRPELVLRPRYVRHVSSLAFSRDGTTLATADSGVRLWDAKNGRLRRTLNPAAEVSGVVFSPDGKTMAGVGVGAGARDVWLWDVATGALQRKLFDASFFTSFDFSPDGRMFASGTADESVRVWDARTGRILHTSDDARIRDVVAVAFSPDSLTLAVGDIFGGLILYDPRRGKVRRIFTGPDRDIVSLAFSRDGNTLAGVAWDTNAGLLDPSTGRLRALRHGKPVSSVAFSPDGTLVGSGSLDKIRLWTARTGALRRTLVDSRGFANRVAFSPDGRTIAASGQSGVRLWAVSDGRLLATLLLLSEKEAEEATEWIALTPLGYYDSSPGAWRFIWWKDGDALLSAEAHARTFHRPDQVQKALRGEP